MTIRPATLSDYEELMALYNNFVGSDRYSHHDGDAFETVLESSGNFVYVAEDAGHLIGFASLSVRPVVRYPRPIAELDELYVAPAGRRHGLGKQLMDQVESTARSHHCYRLFIETAYDRETAHKFYEALGYTNRGYHFFKDL